MKRYIYSGISLFFILLVFCCANSPIWSIDNFSQVTNTVNAFKAKYFKPAQKTINANWALQIDHNVKINQTYCRNKNKPKVEKIGKLSCPGIQYVKYTTNKNNANISLVYSVMTADLVSIVIEVKDTYITKYLYNIKKYPIAELRQVSIFLNNDSIMTFEPSGKLKAYVKDNKSPCFEEGPDSKIRESVFARTTCNQMGKIAFYETKN